MGTGKSAVGRILARRMQREFIETDNLVEAREDMKISEIFSRYGENYFRRKEKEVLKEISGRDNLVVSCGGGIVIDDENRKVLKSTGVVICLETQPDIIYKRVKKYRLRPLLNVEDPKSKIKELLAQRRHFYEEAHHCVDTTHLTTQEVVERILEIVKNG